MNAIDRIKAPTSRPWLSDKDRADIAKAYACDPCEVDARLDARARMDAYIEERRDYYGKGNM